MTREGPDLDRLVHRLAECPGECLAEPRIGASGGVHVDAVVGDLVIDLGGAPSPPKALADFRADDAARAPWLRLVVVASWLLHDGWFVEAGGLAAAALAWLRTGLGDLAALVAPQLFVTDPDRREELARLCLRALGMRPRGESEAAAEDRLRTLDSVSRVSLVKATRQKQEHARRIRREMEEKRAREAAARVSREW